LVGLSHNVGIPDGGVKTSPAIKPTINHQQKHRIPEINGEGPDITTQVHTRTTSATVPTIHWARLQTEIVCIHLYVMAIHAIKLHQATRARYGKTKIPRILKISKKINFVSVTVKRESPSTWWTRNRAGPRKALDTVSVSRTLC